MRNFKPFFLCALCALCGQSAFSALKTNVIFILTDNHGAWTMGCYGNPDVKTPHVDRMAAEGVRFSRAFTNNAVCSPTRATYLTGLMPSQHGVHSFLGGNGLQMGPAARNTLEEFTSLPEILKAEGYKCGLVGKWHLGANLTPQEGLDDYWITMPHGGTSTFHGAQVIENGKVRKEPKYLTDLWTEHALSFIESNKGAPFFLYLAYNGPYGLSRYQLESSGNKHAEYYADKPMNSFPRGAIHPWQHSNREYFGNMTSIRRYGEELTAIDDGVGAILQKLEDTGLAGETLVIFAADQGWAGGQHGLWGMGDHTWPVNAREHSMHIPMIFWHPSDGKQPAPGIPGGRVSDLMVSNYDFMPSVLSYLGLGDRVPRNPAPPGRDFSAVLRGEKIDAWDNAVFYEFESLRCVRTEDWKYVERYGDGYDELYDLAEDPGEMRNLWDEEAHRGKRAELAAKVKGFFSEHATAKYDLWSGGGSQTQLFNWGDEAKQRHVGRANAGNGPIPEVIDPAVEVPPMTLPEGLVAEVAAAPPLTRHPMMASIDDRGRMFIAEAAGINLTSGELDAQTPNFIRMLTDVNGDGIYDEATVFADKMTFPSGTLWHDGALWVTAAPSIWRLEDADDDGVADRREEIVTGFGYTGNAADLHGPFLHPNGRIFWCHGRKDLDVHDKEGTLIHKGKGARIWSCEPDGSDVEIFAGGGMDNPVEITFTPEGEITGSVNLFHGRPRGDTLVHWVYGGAYPRHDQEAVLAEFTRTGELIPEFHNFGQVAVSGMTQYRSGRKTVDPKLVNRVAAGDLGDFEGDIFTSFFNTQKIVRTEVKPRGSTFEAVRTETFLEIDDPDVHLTDVFEDADGTLLVVDTGGWFRNGCPASQIAKPEVAGAIYRVRRAGYVDRSGDARGLKIEWAGASPAALASLLGDDRYAVRDRAIAELAAKGNASCAALEETLAGESAVARQGAVWALTRIGSGESNALLRGALEDADQSVRHAACNGIWRTRDAEAVHGLTGLLEDESPAVQMAAARALGRAGGHSGKAGAMATTALLEYLGRDLDRIQEHAAIYALIEMDRYAETALALKSQSEKVQRRVLWALEGMKSSRIDASLVVSLLDSGEEGVSGAATKICRRHPEWADQIADEILQWRNGETAIHSQIEVINELVPLFLKNEKMQEVITWFFGVGSADVAKRGFDLIAQSPVRVPLNADWRGAFDLALQGRFEHVLSSAMAALGKIDSPQFDERVRAIGDDEGRSPVIRVKALAAASKGAKPLSASSFNLLTELFTSGEAATQRVEAAHLLAEAKMTAAQRREVAGLVAHAGPVELPALLKVFEGARDLETGMALVAALQDSNGVASIQPAELKRLLTRYPPEVYDAAKPLVADLLARSDQQAARLAELETKLESGNATKGREAFLAGKGACNTCHKIGEDGREVGPDLSLIGRIRTKRDLLESLLYPSSSLARDFEPYEIVTKDGHFLFGIIQRETADTIYLIDITGIAKPLARTSIEKIRPGPVSLMPQGLEQAMTPEELVDMVAFLDSLE